MGDTALEYAFCHISFIPSLPGTESSFIKCVGVMFQTSQCVQARVGASESSTISARLFVPSGIPSIDSGGLISSPSLVYFSGIKPLFSNALLVTLRVCVSGQYRSFFSYHGNLIIFYNCMLNRLHIPDGAHFGNHTCSFDCDDIRTRNSGHLPGTTLAVIPWWHPQLQSTIFPLCHDCIWTCYCCRIFQTNQVVQPNFPFWSGWCF